MKDILGKLTSIEATAPKTSAKKKLIEDTSKRELTKKPTLKDVFNQLSENVAPGQKPLPVMDPTNKKAGMGFVTSNNPAVQNMLKNLDPKDVQIVQAPGAPGQTQTQPNTIKPVGAVGTTQGGQGQAMGTGQTMQEDDLDERDEGKPGKNFAKIAKSAGKRYGSKEAGERVAGAVRAKLAKQGKLEEEQLDELSPKTLKSYAKKADIDQAVTNRELKNRYHTGLDPDLMKQSSNRTKGMKMAGDKMMGRAKVPANEEVDMGQAEQGMRKSIPHTGGYQVVDSSGKVISKHKGQRDAMQAALKNDDYKVKPIREGAKVDRMVKHIEKSERKLGKSKDTASDIAWATANKRGMLDNKNKKVKEGDIPSTAGVDTKGAGLGAGRSPTTLEGKTMKKSKPDFLDMDKDGNKKESMKKAVADKKKTVKEGVNGRISAARHEGRADGLRGNINRFKQYDDLEEARAYHDGYKDGLDECYGMGVYEAAPAMPAATVGGMAKAAMPTMEDDMDEGNAFSAALARTPRGGKFSVGGKTFTDRSSHDAKIDEYAFESWDNQLKALVNEGTTVNEGMSVSISKGQQNSPDSVTITAQDAEADQLLSFVKQAGLGIFGGEAPEAGDTSSAMSIQPVDNGEPEANIDVVDGSDGMLSLMKKLGGISSSQGEEDFADEEGHSGCDSCGSSSCECGGEEQIEEVESEDQEEFEVAEANAPDTGADNTNADVAGQVGADNALATADAGQDMEDGMSDQAVQESDDEEDEDFFHNPNVPDDKQLPRPPKEINVKESFMDLYKKLSFLSEESTEDDEEHYDKDGNVDPNGAYDAAGHYNAERDADKNDNERSKKKDEKLDEWANKAGPGNTVSDTTFEQDIDFMTKVIAGGLNKPKSTGQTTVPIIAHQEDRMHDNPKDWATLAGIKK